MKMSHALAMDRATASLLARATGLDGKLVESETKKVALSVHCKEAEFKNG